MKELILYPDENEFNLLIDSIDAKCKKLQIEIDALQIELNRAENFKLLLKKKWQNTNEQ